MKATRGCCPSLLVIGGAASVDAVVVKVLKYAITGAKGVWEMAVIVRKGDADKFSKRME